MTIQYADLHIHTYYSDGTSSPEEVVQEAIWKGLSCISITDHDVVDAIKPAMKAAQTHGLEVVPGIELSSEIDGKDIHILGYFFNYTGSVLTEKLESIQQARVERMKKMIEKLHGMGMTGITLEEVCSLTRSRSVGRPHLARVMLEKKYISSIKEAFDKYIGEGRSAYYTKYNQTPFEAIDLIKKSGGLAVMAHPMLTQKDELIKKFKEAGLDGLEVYYPNCSGEVTRFYENLAKKYDLLMTGGSDAHGSVKSYTHVGKMAIPYELVEKMQQMNQENSKDKIQRSK